MSRAGETVVAGADSRRSAALALFGVVVDALLFVWLSSQGTGLALAHILSFLPAAAIHYSLLPR